MDPFVGQLALVGFNFNPVGWQIAAGQLLSISQNTALFSLLGTYYGGDGRSNFALPNLQGNVALGYGQSLGGSDYVIGEQGGSPTVTLLPTETPGHTHSVQSASLRGNLPTPGTNAFSDAKETGNLYATVTTPPAAMSPNAVSPFPGGSQPHNNRMPYVGMYWIIAMQGVFPARG